MQDPYIYGCLSRIADALETQNDINLKLVKLIEEQNELAKKMAMNTIGVNPFIDDL